MQIPHARELLAERYALVDSEFAAEVLLGLSKPQKSLPCRFLYDARGSELFEEITQLPEYYPTRAEAAILKKHAAEMTKGLPRDGILIEFGSGSSLKTEILLAELPRLTAYVPIDVSQSALDEASQRLARRFPALKVLPIVGDFLLPTALPAELLPAPKMGFFPGSTIGNLTPVQSQRLLRIFRAMLAPQARLIIGVDLKKDLRTLIPAYNDAAGVTAAFNLNMLTRINRELAGTFDLQTFQHEAIYNRRDGRIEMHLVSRKSQSVAVCGRRFDFKSGESIHTENSYKYSVDQFKSLARSAEWVPERVWTDDKDLFSVHELVSA